MLLKTQAYVTTYQAMHDALNTTSDVGHRLQALGIQDHDTIDSKRGSGTETRIATLLYVVLNGLHAVHLAPKHSLADDTYKVDLYLHTTAGAVLGFQVKSSKDAALRFHTQHPHVPVLWLDVHSSTDPKALVDEVIALAEGYVEYKDWVLQAMAIRDAAMSKGMHTLSDVAARALLSVEQRKALELLGLGLRTKGGYTFR